MRAFLFLVVLLSTYYIAAVFRFTPLLVMCLAEGAALVFLLLSVWILRGKLRVSLEERSGEAVRGAERPCAVRTKNPALLPAPRLELRLAARWLWEEREGILFLYGGAEHGTSRLAFHIRAAHCGLLSLRLDRVRVYDWLGLFHASRKAGEELCLAVYPEPVPLRVRLAGSDWDGGGRSTDRPGDDSGEVLKIREYQPGDPLRRVHWNLSARTDRLWMKEFPREADRRVHILLEPGSWDSPWAADGFWQVLYSLSLGLLDTVAVVRFHWLDSGTGGADETSGADGTVRTGGGTDAPRFFDAADLEQVRELLLTLYRVFLPGMAEQEAASKHGKKRKRRTENRRAVEQAAPSAGSPVPDPRLLEQIPQGDRFLRLTGGLRLYTEGTEAVRFSAKGLTDQIRAAKLDL